MQASREEVSSNGKYGTGGAMSSLLWSGAARRISIHLFYRAWIRISAIGVILWTALSADSPWFAQAGLTIILILLLAGGILLLVLGTRDFIRDLRQSLHAGSHK
jgi:hypothetical protein